MNDCERSPHPFFFGSHCQSARGDSEGYRCLFPPGSREYFSCWLVCTSLGRTPIEPDVSLVEEDQFRQSSHRKSHVEVPTVVLAREERRACCLPLSIEHRRRAPSSTATTHCRLKIHSFPIFSRLLPLLSSPLPTIFIHTIIYRTLCSSGYRFSCLELLTGDLLTVYTATVITFPAFPTGYALHHAVLHPKHLLCCSLAPHSIAGGSHCLRKPYIQYRQVRGSIPHPVVWR